jgi:hypothetical protein
VQSEPKGWTRYLIRLVSVGVFLSFFLATDLFLSFFCAAWPAIFYLVATALGVLYAERLYRRFSGHTFRSRIVRRIAVGLAVFSATSLMVLFSKPVNWDSKCSWRHCGRALGVGLLESPVPVGTPNCSAWHMCANEFRFSKSEYRELLRRMDEQGCAEP